MKSFRKSFSTKLITTLAAILLILPVVSAQENYFEVVREKTEKSLEKEGKVFEPRSMELIDNTNLSFLDPPWYQKINYEYAVFNANCYAALKEMPPDIIEGYEKYSFFRSYEGGILTGVLGTILVCFIAISLSSL